MADQIENTNINLSFIIDKKKYDLEVAEETLTWKESGRKHDKISSLKYEDIIGVDQSELKDGNITVILDYVNKKSVKWIPKKLKLISSNSRDCESLVTRLREKLSSISDRPKSLLVFVNPDGGAKTGVKTYRGTVEPLFKLAGITTDLVVTKDGNHAGEVLETYDLSKVDGLVSVGGDGTFRQVLHGLMTRVARDQGKDVNNPETEWSSPAQTIGIIPCGTGQGVIMALNGTADVKTAALHIILGSQSDYDLFSVYNGGKLLSLAGLLFGYGIFGKLIEYSETHRSLGRPRYAVASAKLIFGSIDVFEAEVNYIPSADHKSQENHNDAPNLEVVKPDSDGWITERGRFIAINMFSLPAPWTLHRTEPSMSLTLLGERFTKMQLFKFFMRTALMRSDAVDFEHLTEVPCSRYKITHLGEETINILNIDGDPFPITDNVIEVRHLPKKIKTYGDLQGTMEAIREKHMKKK